MRLRLFTQSCLLLLFFSAATAWADSSLQFSDSWLRQAPPSAKYLAAYGELKNTSAFDVAVVAMSSKLFEKVEIHHSRFQNGMMKMTRVEKLTLKPGESVVFKPGARHLMMMKPISPIRAGDIVPLIFTLNTGQDHHFDLPVKR